MSFSAKWNARQLSLELLSYFLCFTTLLVIVPIAVDFRELFDYGFDAYPDYKLVRKCPAPGYVATVFWHLSVAAKLKLLLLTVPADILLRRFAWGLRD